MAKQKSSQRFVFKISSSRLRQNNWELNLTPHEARRNEELIALSESTVLRFIDELRGIHNADNLVKDIKGQIKQLKKIANSMDTKIEVRKLYDSLDELQFKKDYVCLVIDKVKDYRDACKRGFMINGVKYKRLLGTTGGVKNSTIVFISEDVHNEIWRRIENGRNPDMPIVPAKLEAYKALSCSASIPVTHPKGVLVVDDVITKFKSDVINLDDTELGEPVMKMEYDKEIELNVSDGCGMIMPSLAEKWAKDLDLDYLPSGFCTRNSWEKGMVFTFDAVDFANKIAGNYIVKDIWGQEHDIRNIELVLTASMLKLWDNYSSIDDYLNNCKLNGYEFSVTKIAPRELENERSLNYQFIQSFRLSDDDINELIQPTIDEIKDVLGNDYRKSILFLKGTHLNEDNVNHIEDDYVKALMIDKNMINDPFVRNKIHFMIKKRIDDAKTGVVKVHGNFSVISGDLYALCQNMFGMEVTGLLKAKECYNHYWGNRGINRIAMFRAPMTCHNNIRVLDVAYTDDMQYWYQYMNTVTILNSWDTTCDALNGADKDGDMVLITDNRVLVDNVRELPTIMCVQRRAEKRIVSVADLIQANINSFGDEIGTTTNRITSIFEVMSQFGIDTPQYKVLNYRATCGQLFQQNAIDKTKGILAKPMPKTWYDRRSNWYDEEASEEEKELKDFNTEILADKKPYFMCYVYPSLMSDYNKYIADSDKSCMLLFGLHLKSVEDKVDKSEEEISFLKYYNSHFPVGMNSCIINKIAWRFEKEFDDYLDNFTLDNSFDYTILKSDTTYKKTMYLELDKLYQSFKQKLSYLATRARKERMSVDHVNNIRKQMKYFFTKECSIVCPNVEMLSNIVLDLCYTSNNSKQFSWDICGDYIITNMLTRNNNTISYPVRNKENPDFYYGGDGYKMEKYKYKRKEMEAQWF